MKMDKGAEVIHNSEEIRSFIAIELPEEVKSGLARLKGELERNKLTFVKWVDPEGIHLTLKFLGNIPPKLVAEISSVIKGASEKITPFHLEVAGLGAFPNPKQPRVVWVGVYGEMDKLSRLQQNIDSALAPLGFSKEERPFTAHLTLARVRQGASSIQIKSFGDLVMSANFATRYSFEVGAVSLMRSQLTSRGAIYTRLSMVELVNQNI